MSHSDASDNVRAVEEGIRSNDVRDVVSHNVVMKGRRMISVFLVDAFAERPFAGNPAAVCLLESPTDEGWLPESPCYNF